MADDNGMQDWAAAYNGEGQERAANNDGIRHQQKRRNVVFGGGHTFLCCEYDMLFLAGVVPFDILLYCSLLVPCTTLLPLSLSFNSVPEKF